MESKELLTLYRKVDACTFCTADKNLLQHIHGFGALNPRLMLVLVNPTYRNISSDPAYLGARFPFLGVRQFWKVLAAGGLIDKNITDQLPLRKDWTQTHTEQIKGELVRNRLFLTNIVKCCYGHSAYPANGVVKDSMQTLAQEIRIVNPKKIVAFSGLVYKTLTGKDVKLSAYWTGKKRERSREIVSGLEIATEPCYFPVGRGNPAKAAQVLKLMKK